MLPTAADLEDPEAFVGSSEPSDLDISDLENDTDDKDDAGGEDGTSN
jgi:hypothetical protein